MADQIFNVKCGFFDAVNNDRTYTADQMNLPYKRLVADGVFATPQGTPSTDLQVVSASSGMNIIVNPGNGMFGGKWFENPAAINITVPNNTSLLPRVDSVIVQVDTRTSGRAGNIVYRTGTPASSPAAPSINTVAGVTEFRLANIYVAASAQNINNDAITDLRGSSSCPWVAALVMQPDMSTIYQNFFTAYEQRFNEFTTDYEEYVEEQRAAWEAFLSTLTSELEVTTNVVMYESVYTATGTATNIPVGIQSFDANADILQVFINGLLAVENVDYTLASDKTSINLTNAIKAGNSVYFVVFKSLISGDIQSAVTLMRSLDSKVDNFMADGGWINFTLESGATAYNTSLKPAVRCIGNRVYLRGAFKGVTQTGKTICTLPVNYRPAMDHIYLTAAVNGTSINDTVIMRVSASDGTIKLSAVSGTLSSSDMISLATSFLANAGNTAASIYTYKGSVSTYANLPTSDVNIGDVYTVAAADPTHSIAAGDDVMWNGSEWELYTSVINSADIDSIIETIS